MIDLPTFRQGDPAWGDKRLAETDLTIASHGCYLTSVAMMLYPMLKLDPGQFHDLAYAHNGFDSEGQIFWLSVERLTGNKAMYVERVYTDLDPRNNGAEKKVEVAIGKVRRYLDLGCPVVLCVDAIGNDNIADHAILAVDYVLDGDKVADFTVKDPAYGETVPFSKRYGDIRKKLFGYVGFVMPSAMFPDQSKLKWLNGAAFKAARVYRGMDVPTYSKEILDDILSV